MANIETMLKQLRDSYLAEFPDRIQNMESLVLQLKEKKDPEVFQELYRQVHSQKGTSGTHGIHIVSAICHQLEDELAEIDNDLNQLSDNYINNWLDYLDLLTEAREFTLRGDSDASAIEEKLASLRNKIAKTSYSCILVDTANTTVKMIQDILKQHSIHTTVMEDGYQVLGRLLVDRFDMLICGMEIASLNGLGLITAIKSSSSVNSRIPSILITSSDYERTVRSTDPDIIIRKDPKLPYNLDDACQKVIEGLNKK